VTTNNKFNIKINPDTSTPEKIQDTNLKLVTYMKTKGEDVAANRIEGLMSNQSSDNSGTKTNQDDRLLNVDKKILSTLEKIQRDMIDEQDTSIKHAPKKNVNDLIKKASFNDSSYMEETSSDGSGFGFDTRMMDLKSSDEKAKKNHLFF